MSTRQQSTRLQSNRLLHIFVYSYKLVYANFFLNFESAIHEISCRKNVSTAMLSKFNG